MSNYGLQYSNWYLIKKWKHYFCILAQTGIIFLCILNKFFIIILCVDINKAINRLMQHKCFKYEVVGEW